MQRVLQIDALEMCVDDLLDHLPRDLKLANPTEVPGVSLGDHHKTVRSILDGISPVSQMFWTRSTSRRQVSPTPSSPSVLIAYQFVFLADETFANEKKQSADETLTANERLSVTSQNLSLAITLSFAVAKTVCMLNCSSVGILFIPYIRGLPDVVDTDLL